uniref:hypothetical protein n=1 Tax=Pseudomonas fluorescens TaxID=294 RepID=UPI00155DD1A4|nr:hypothetical protein [Pseudomonas fluorescens]
MKIRITQTLEYTIELEVDCSDERAAIAEGVKLATDIQLADWDGTWEPTSVVGCMLAD